MPPTGDGLFNLCQCTGNLIGVIRPYDGLQAAEAVRTGVVANGKGLQQHI
jgi:hypothetical protein